MSYPFQYANITRVVPVDLTTQDFADDRGFFVRSGGGGTLKYLPADNSETEPITKTLDASAYFNDCELVKKIFKTGTDATDIYAGYGV